MSVHDLAAILSPTITRHTCPECEGIGGFPGVDVDGTAIQSVCRVCDGTCTVSREVWLDWSADSFLR